MSKPEFYWPTLGDRAKTWEGNCEHCGKEFPAASQILAVWDEGAFFIACACSPKSWVKMEVSRNE